jgi:hypothetical protein
MRQPEGKHVSENTAVAKRDAEDERFRYEASKHAEQVLDRVIACSGIEESLELVPWAGMLRAELAEAVRQALLGETLPERPSLAQAFKAWRVAWLAARDPGLAQCATVVETWPYWAFWWVFGLLVVVLVNGVLSLAVYIIEALGARWSHTHWGILFYLCACPALVVVCILLWWLNGVLARRATRSRQEQVRQRWAERAAVTGRVFDDDLYQALSARARAAIDAAKDEDADSRRRLLADPGGGDSRRLSGEQEPAVPSALITQQATMKSGT